jgi:tellurite resistance protein TerC
VPLQVTAWHWLGFTAFVLAAIGADLTLMHRKSREQSFPEAMGWTLLWVALALVFGLYAAPRLTPGWRHTHSATFLTGYVVELALSMDNVFVIAVIFRYFKTPSELQHRLLFWGVLGALVMRGLMIGAGAVLVAKVHAVLYLMGAFLVWTGFKMLREDGAEEEGDLSHNRLIKVLREWLPLTDQYHGDKFVVSVPGGRLVTPLLMALVVIETTDVAFAVDSIPAIFGVTSDAFLVYTSNIFAILGLRSLFFVLAAAMGYFRLLKMGLSLVLILIGVKMVTEKPLTAWFGDRLMYISLAAVLGVIAASMIGSVALGWIEAWRARASERGR